MRLLVHRGIVGFAVRSRLLVAWDRPARSAGLVLGGLAGRATWSHELAFAPVHEGRRAEWKTGASHRRHQTDFAAVDRNAKWPQRDQRLWVDVPFGPILRRPDGNGEVQMRSGFLHPGVAEKADHI